MDLEGDVVGDSSLKLSKVGLSSVLASEMGLRVTGEMDAAHTQSATLHILLASGGVQGCSSW